MNMSSLVTHAFCAKRPSCFSWPVERPEHIHTDILAAAAARRRRAVGTFLLLEGLTMLKPSPLHCAPRLIKKTRENV